LHSDTIIDILSIDVEGHDYEVLLGLDFSLYKPQIICVEIHDFDIQKQNENNVVKYLIEINIKSNISILLMSFLKEYNL